MNIGEPNPVNLSRGEPDQQLSNLEEVMKAIQPKLDAHPDTQKIPSAPLDENEYQESAKKARAAGLTVCKDPSEHIVVGGEFLQRSTLIAARVGVHKGRRVLSILYRSTPKRLRAFIFYPSNRIDARDLGKWVMWGVSSDIPESLVQSQIVGMEEFLRINACDFTQLLECPHVAFEVSKVRDEMKKLLSLEEGARLRAERSSEDLTKKLADRTAAWEILSNSYEAESESRYRWQVTALLAMVLLMLAVLGLFVTA